MNILQLTQRMGSVKFGDMGSTDEVVRRLNDLLPPEINVDINTSGDDFIKIYEELPIDAKKIVTSFSLNDNPQAVVEILNDLSYIEAQQRDNRERDESARHSQYLFTLFLILAINTWLAYSYHKHATEVLGQEYESTLIDFVADVVNLAEQANATK